MRLPLLSPKNETETDKHRRELDRRRAELTQRLNDIRLSYDMAVDDADIDALIYEENAVLCRLDRLYKEARAEGIAIEPYIDG